MMGYLLRNRILFIGGRITDQVRGCDLLVRLCMPIRGGASLLQPLHTTDGDASGRAAARARGHG